MASLMQFLLIHEQARVGVGGPNQEDEQEGREEERKRERERERELNAGFNLSWDHWNSFLD